MGGVNDPIQDFSNLVGIRSREQEELEELNITERISCSVTGRKLDSWGGGGSMGLSAKLKVLAHRGAKVGYLIIEEIQE